LCSAADLYQEEFYEHFRVRVKHTGLVYWAFGGPLQISCPIDTTMYPFDRQRCRVNLENFMYSTEYVDLQHGANEVHIEGRQDSGIYRRLM